MEKLEVKIELRLGNESATFMLERENFINHEKKLQMSWNNLRMLPQLINDKKFWNNVMEQSNKLYLRNYPEDELYEQSE